MTQLFVMVYINWYDHMLLHMHIEDIVSANMVSSREELPNLRLV